MNAAVVRRALSGRRAVIFDWDGTLADTQERNYRALRSALAAHNVALDRDWYRRHVGLAIRDLLAAAPIPPDTPIEDIVAASRAALLASTRPDTIRPVPATIEFLDLARRAGLTLAVASSAGSQLVHAGLHAFALTELFRTVVTADDVAATKPAPDVYLEASRRLGVHPHHCLAVEDSDEGIEAARLAGMRVLAVRRQRLTWPPNSAHRSGSRR